MLSSQPWQFAAAREPVPPYRPRRRCPKCGCRWIRTRWVRIPRDVATPADGLLREFLARICWRCGFWWPEKPLDNDKTERTVW